MKLNSPILIDGTLYTALAIFLFLQNQFASDEAGKYISLKNLFYIKTVIGSFAAGLLAIKLFRSTTFAKHEQQQLADDTQEVQTTVTKPKPSQRAIHGASVKTLKVKQE